ncbi:MAG TPA: hypothetical protein VF198_11600 [Vicinamibacterales bacterium]
MGLRCLALLVALAGTPAWAAAQSSSSALVVIVKGSTQFHAPTCPVVARAGSNVAVSRRAEALRRGLTAHDCGDAAEAKANPNAVKVFTQKDDNKYHRESCEKLGRERSSLTLDEAGRKLWPCPVCRPPIRQRVQKTPAS